MSHLLCFGLGFTGKVIAQRLADKGWRITGTSRTAEGAAEIASLGYRAYRFDGTSTLPRHVFEDARFILVSIPPGEAGDPVIHQHGDDIARVARSLAWLGYLSTTGVYGDHGGGWVDEETPLTPDTERGHRRLKAENGWLQLHLSHELPVHIFRLAGIYGPGRNQLIALKEGSARRIVKQGQIFSRIHVEDIASVLEASMAKPNSGRAYNVADDEPCPPQDVVEYGAKLLGPPVPEAIPFEKANLSPMARSFYADSKRVSNSRIKRELGVTLMYPSYREGLAALVRDVRR